MGTPDSAAEWRRSYWSDIFSLSPDLLYGFVIAWLCAALRSRIGSLPATGLTSGVFVALVGGVTTYLALANSGFIPWSLASASFLPVIATKIPLALVGAWMLDRRGQSDPEAFPID